MLIVVAIIAVLGGLAFIAVYNYQRSLGQLERDGIAKEIFVAAQNHLTMAYGEGYLGAGDYGESEAVDKDGNPVGDVYYYVVNGDIDETSVIGQMLPFGSIDETVRAGGSYIIRYQKDTGMVLDVFYCSRNGSSHAQYDHDLASGEYSTVLGLRDTETASNKSARRNWNGHILGWYGGAEAATLPTLKLDAPVIEVVNKDILYAEVTDPNSGKEGAMLKIIIEGLSSGAKKAIDLKTANARVKPDLMSGKITVVLDDITKTGLHFAELDADTAGVSFIPGENVSIRAVAYSTSALANIAYSTICTTNSLYAAIDDSDSDKTYETACVAYIRHLENLDRKVSNLGAAQTVSTDKLEKFKIQKAVQTSDMDWETFKTDTERDAVFYSTGTGGSYNATTSSTQYYPVSPDYALTYDGQGNSISNIETEFKDAGVFGSVQSGTVSEIKNLELIDFSAKGTDSAGALAGTVEGCEITNVLARCKDGSAESVANRITATATGAAGGLIGKLTSGSVKYSAAAVIVGDTGAKPSIAGGLIGNAAGGTISGCYSAGFVEDIKAGGKVAGVQYSKTAFNVSGTTAGGLVGESDAAITNSYSTCSVSGSTAGGFAGNAGGSITNCYSTGYIDPGAAAKYAFIGSGSPGSGNYYYMAINEVASAAPGEGGKKGTEPMLPYDGYDLETKLGVIKPLDMNAKAYNEFTGAWNDWGFARPYNSSLVKYYGGKYPLKTIKELDTDYTGTDDYFVVTHYGDWPSPEVFFINN